jgi:hypothetical protein
MDIDRRIRVLEGREGEDSGIARVSDLHDLPFVVLLGEPGIGKSTVLAAEAARENLTLVTVRELMTGTEISPGIPLYLDALDEYRTDGGAEDKAHSFANAILKHAPPRWRLTCRSEDWRKSADIAPIKKTTSGNPITVAQLLPLDTDEAVAILRSWGEQDPERFVRNAESFGAMAFLENPLGLKLLRKAVADGGTWPANRFELFAAAVRKLSYEHSDVRVLTERHDPDTILNAAAEACLVLLASGARAVWRSNREPPSMGDTREFVTWHDLGISRGLLDDMLDTPLFRGEGEAFEPMHKTVAEFLAGRALSAAVRGSRARAALPLSRALAFITAEDGTAPTELRGLYAWFAAHLAHDGANSEAIRLIQRDAVSVLHYGDAAIFSTAGRRAILANLGQSDPYFRGSDVGVTAVGGLAGEDLAADFAEVLTDPSNSSHRRYTVFEALTVGRPVRSLAPLLRSIVLDPQSPEWYRLRALEALLNGCDDPGRLRREILDDLATEAASSAREAVRSQLAGGFADGQLTVADVRSVLADYCVCEPDNMLGRLRALQDRIEADPMPELFEIPLVEWLPARPGHDNQRDHRIEVGHTLDYALAAAIRADPPPPSSLWRWIANTRRGGLAKLKTQAAKAFKNWLDQCPVREIAFFNEIVASAKATDGPWLPTNKFITLAGRTPSVEVVRALLRQIDDMAPGEELGLLAVVVEIVNVGRDPDAYWSTYDRVARSGDGSLLERLTCCAVETWRQEQATRNAQSRREKERQRLKNVADLMPQIDALKSGAHASALGWGAEHYFACGEDPDVGRIAARADPAIADAIVRGWDAVVVNGLGDVGVRELGVAGAEGRHYYIEEAAVAGVYRRLVDEDGMSTLIEAPLDVAVAVLKSSITANDNGRGDKLDRWAMDRLDADPKEGAEQILLYWTAALDAGSTTLPSLWKYDSERKSPAFRLALIESLRTRPGMHVEALRSALRAAPRALDKSTLMDLAKAALSDPTVENTCRHLWLLVACVLDPAAQTGFPASDQRIDMSSAFSEKANADLIGSISGMPGVDRLPIQALTVSLLGRTVAPEGERRRTRVMDVPRNSETVRNCINFIAADPRPDAASTLARLLSDRTLGSWMTELRHAQAQQMRIMRDRNFRHPPASVVRAAIDGGPPVNASDLRAIVLSALHQLRSELRSTATTPWKRYWNNTNGNVTTPLIENECRDNLLDRLGDRLEKFRIAAAIPEARRGEATRTDVLVLSGAGRNLPIEIKRHFHPDLWTAAATQLQGYASDPGAAGIGIYFVFWFGDVVQSTPARPDGRNKPTSAEELEAMLVEGLDADLVDRTDVIVFDVSNPGATRPAKTVKPASARRRKPNKPR